MYTMRQVNIRTLRMNFAKELKNLPFEITRNGKIVAVAEEIGKVYTIKEQTLPEKKEVYTMKPNKPKKKRFVPMLNSYVEE